jgi:hypothetical protein
MYKWLSRAGASVESEKSRPISRLGDLVEPARKNLLLNLWWIARGRAPAGVQINLMEFQVFFANRHGRPSGRKSGGLGKFILERITVEDAVDELGATIPIESAEAVSFGHEGRACIEHLVLRVTGGEFRTGAAASSRAKSQA